MRGTWSAGWALRLNNDAGKDAMAEHSPKPPKLTRSQNRYRAWLREDMGRTFAQFMGIRQKKQPEYF